MRLVDADAINRYLEKQGLPRILVLDTAPTIDAVPIGCLEFERRNQGLENASTLGNTNARDRMNACKNIMDWYKSPMYPKSLESAEQLGLITQKWK